MCEEAERLGFHAKVGEGVMLVLMVVVKEPQEGEEEEREEVEEGEVLTVREQDMKEGMEEMLREKKRMVARKEINFQEVP